MVHPAKCIPRPLSAAGLLQSTPYGSGNLSVSYKRLIVEQYYFHRMTEHQSQHGREYIRVPHDTEFIPHLGQHAISWAGQREMYIREMVELGENPIYSLINTE